MKYRLIYDVMDRRRQADRRFLYDDYSFGKTTVDIDVDYQSANIVWVYEPTLEVMAATGFDDWIEYVDHSTDIEQDKNRVTMDITCKIKQEMSLGTTTSWSKITISYPAVFRNVI